MATKNPRSRTTGTMDAPEVVDLAADRSHLSRAERFVLEQADFLAAQSGRTVIVTRYDGSSFFEAEYLHVYSPSPRWFEHAITLGARGMKGSLSGSRFAWAFTGANVIGMSSAKAKTYAAAAILVTTYGTTAGSTR